MLFAAVGAIGLALLTLASPASAQGIFERIFGGLRQATEPARAPTNISAFADPLSSLANAINPPPRQRADSGPSKAFCVRSCDGHFFPVQAQSGLSAAESCHAFCPASQTRLYSGSTIDIAVASDGSRYADLDNAFVYRRQLIDGCTCNGRDHFGLARVDVNSDPTLRPGDVVATKDGMAAFTGTKNNVAEFTPVSSDRTLSKSYRDRLASLKIMPPTPTNATPVTQPLRAERAPSDNRRSAQR